VLTTPAELSLELDVPQKRIRDYLRSEHGVLPPGTTRWELTDEQADAVREFFRGPLGQRPFRDSSVQDLLAQYADILAELRTRGVVRTSNAPLGDYAEYLSAKVYGGELAPNPAKSHDIVTADGHTRVQVKARTVTPTTSRSAVFSVFRSFDFDVAVLLAFSGTTYELMWAREMTPEEIRERARWSPHVNGFLLRISIAESHGTDATERFKSEHE